MKSIIWEEMYYAKKNEEYIVLYISFIKSTKKYIDFSTLIFSSLGVASWLSDKDGSKIIMGISLVLVAVLQVIEIIQIKFIASDEYIDDIRDLKSKWSMYFNDLEDILIDIKVNKVDDKTSASSFQKLKPLKQEIEHIDSDIKIWNRKKINTKADLLTNNFMKRYHEQK
jgi:hypothetical protein